MPRICLATFVLLLAGAGTPRATPGRYLYVVGCGARLDKLDTVAERKIASWDLAARSRGLIPDEKGAIDGCLAWKAVYDARASIFYTVVPFHIRNKPDGTQDYRALGFSIPDVRLVMTMPAGENLDEPPHLEPGAEGVRIATAPEGAPDTAMDLSAFAPEKTDISNEILESSGDRVLLRVFTGADPDSAFAVADRRSRTVVRLRDLPSTVPSHIHIAPGGGAVLVEAESGELVLFDGNTGAPIRHFAGPQGRKMYFLAISPTGRAVYHSNDAYWFADLGATFASAPVTRPPGGDIEYPGLFFADQ